MSINNKWSHLQVRKVWFNTTGRMKIYSSFYFKSSRDISPNTLSESAHSKNNAFNFSEVPNLLTIFTKKRKKKLKIGFQWSLKGSFSEVRHLCSCVFYLSLYGTRISCCHSNKITPCLLELSDLFTQYISLQQYS